MKFISLNPKQLFILDGLGALASALLLGLVLPQFESFFGIPLEALYLLALPPLAFVAFDACGYFSNTTLQYKLLKVIAIANLSYCAFSLGMAWYHSTSITTWGWLYILGEIVIVLGIAHLEWHAVPEAS